MKFYVTVTVTLKKGVLDPQGVAVEKACKSHGNNGITKVRIGKIIQFELEAENKLIAEQQVKTISDQLLANPVMEVYSYKIEE